MKGIVAVLWLAVKRGLSLNVGGATEGGIHFNAGPENSVTNDVSDDADLKGWIAPESMATIDREAADRQMARSESLEVIDELVNSQRYAAYPMEISAICIRFGLNAQSCARVEAYLGRLAHNRTKQTVKLRGFFSGTITAKANVFAIGVRSMCEAPADSACDIYRRDFCKVVTAASGRALLGDKAALFKFGDTRDAHACYPTFYKTRLMKLRDDNYVLLDLNHDRHWGMVGQVPGADVSWSQKRTQLVWRGASTGRCDAYFNNTRMMLVRKYFHSQDPRIDVGFSEALQHCDAARSYVKPGMSMQTVLAAKYVLVAQGNDKASGLNWALASNSVPFMVEPDIESWLLESSLKAWEHYIPIEPDFSDLGSQVEWAVQNDGEAERIAKAGKDYMQQFKNRKTETDIEAAVLTAYLDRMDVRTSKLSGVVDGHLEKTCLETP
ncbi:unnamed protein product [Prorocentrum cordatum]|uniref:Glycosyl transferase CAP10 domain-containing protein n=1 Tax=Prorocentrum cordatum TaxID=2364126 RepID=A0ABN9Q2C9_9DINO|nr:unnamed protein product [Polarella glacialis]|mmetsp:Transcript_98531/g.256762  ORF Transcript_98531/g.256762 Transcript_98531/m.256762 type:complete len:439 (-) Transcript_98531:25-1341(-)